MIRHTITSCLALAIAWICGTACHAQLQQNVPQQFQGRTAGGGVSGYNTPAMRYFGTGASNLAAPQAPQRPRFQRPPLTPTKPRIRTKPFAGAPTQSNLSPYLALDLRESESSIPNYHAYVRPLLQQSRQNQRQRTQFQQLQNQVQTISAPNSTNGVTPVSTPATGHATQFLNAGGYFPAR